MFRQRYNPTVPQLATGASHGTLTRTLGWTAVLAIALTVLAGLGYLSHTKLESWEAPVTAFVSVADHNSLVRANNKLAVLASNLQESLNLQQRVVENVALRQETLERSVHSLEPLTNLYVKLDELEELMTEQRCAIAGLNGATNAVGARLDGLQRAMIRLSQGLQQLQSLAPTNHPGQ